jgi:hypothetical protein
VFDLFPLSTAMGPFYDFLGNASDIALKVPLLWATGNSLIKEKAVVSGF